ncbi:MAG: hypothetical protein LWX56_00390 [Ignavibacteria bacterium]|nr:hypothetical protein [Ignavibacteria bacterium]
MKYFIGIDGGGTKSHGLLVDENKNIIAEHLGGPTNFLLLGTEKVCETVFNLLKELREKAQVHYNQIEAVFLGTTGAGRRTDAQQLEVEFSKYCTKQNQTFKNFFVDSDALAALEGAFEGAPGSILIAGTGSIMFGKDYKDILYRVGGFGRFIGDEGSGYSIGKKGLIAVARQFDGRGGHTLLYNLLVKEFNINTPEDLITRIYKQNYDIASFAPFVFQAAMQGDAVANDIVLSECDALLEHIVAMHKKIPVKTLDIAFIGSIITSENVFSSRLRARITEQLSDVCVKEALHSPAFGAALLAIKKVHN